MYHYYTEQHQIEGLLPKLMQYDAWGFDVETTGRDAHKDKTVLVQFGRPEVQHMIDTRTVNIEPLRPFLESREIKKIGHNLKFDYKMTKGTHKIDTENLRCTFTAEKVLHAGRRHYFQQAGLADVVEERLGIILDKTLQKSFMTHVGPFTTEQLTYAANDVSHMIPLFHHQVADLTRDGLNKVYMIETGCIPAFGDMEYDGMLLDVEKWRAIMVDNKAKLDIAEKRLRELAEPYIGPDLFGNVNINFGSPAQVLSLLKLMRVRIPVIDKYGKPAKDANGKDLMELVKNTNKQTLKKIRHIEFIKELEKWRSCDVRLNTFGQPYIDALHPLTGALHPDLWPMGTETGRPSSGDSDCNPLNIPRDNCYRNAFVAAQDEVVESDDYSGCESRILTHISGDPILNGIFARKEDIHCSVATMMYGVEVTKKNENKKLRTPAKSLNFGISYGLGPGKLCEDLNGEGFPMTVDEAKKLYYKYCDKFEVAVGYLREVGRLAAQQGFLVNINGRRRYYKLPDPAQFEGGSRDPLYKGKIGMIERSGGNFMIQSVNADITKQAMIEIRDYAKANKIRTHFVNAVYDEIVTRTHKDDSPSFHAMKLKIMQDVAERMITTVPMEVDGNVGLFWNK